MQTERLFSLGTPYFENLLYTVKHLKFLTNYSFSCNLATSVRALANLNILNSEGFHNRHQE